MAAVESSYILAPKIPQVLPHLSPQRLAPTRASPCTTPVGATLPLLGRKVSNHKHKPVLCPFKGKKDGGVFSSSFHLSSAQRALAAFHLWIIHGGLILVLALCA